MGGHAPRSVRRAVEREAEGWVGVRVDFHPGNKHPFMTITCNGKSRRIGMSATPKDQDTAAMEAVRDLRRALADMKAVERPAPVRAPRDPDKAHPRAPVQRAPAKPEAETREAASPFAPLRRLQAGLTAEQLGPWARFRIPPENLDKGARLLISLWHPGFILRAADFILEHVREENVESEGAPEGVDALAEERRTG